MIKINFHSATKCQCIRDLAVKRYDETLWDVQARFNVEFTLETLLVATCITLINVTTNYHTLLVVARVTALAPSEVLIQNSTRSQRWLSRLRLVADVDCASQVRLKASPLIVLRFVNWSTILIHKNSGYDNIVANPVPKVQLNAVVDSTVTVNSMLSPHLQSKDSWESRLNHRRGHGRR